MTFDVTASVKLGLQDAIFLTDSLVIMLGHYARSLCEFHSDAICRSQQIPPCNPGLNKRNQQRMTAPVG